MKRLYFHSVIFLIPVSVLFLLSRAGGQAASVALQAESGVLGAGFTTNTDGSIAYITAASNGTGGNPGGATRVATYTVTFPEAGTYGLFARVRVGSGGADDDSFFYGNGFGTKSPTSDADWILVNNLNSAGFTVTTDVVTGNGSAGNSVWKWVNLSEFSNGGETPITFTVAAGNLTQTFQIGARENGLYIDALVWGTASLAFTVGDLDTLVGGAPPPPPPPGTPCRVDWNNVRQRIDGFGASSAWRTTWTTAQADMFFTTNSGTGVAKDSTTFSYTGIGLSLLRNHINPDGTTVETNMMVMAQARGARVWSVPWSPPAAMKSNNSINNGGSLLPGSYQAYANQLANYVLTMKNTCGVNLYAISVQNEPDQTTSYESCVWTAQQIHDFVPYLYNALSNNGVSSTKIVIPEKSNWDFALATTTMNDTKTAAMIGVLACHSYGTAPSAVNNYGKALWQTEDSFLSGDDRTINNGIIWAAEIHAFMTIAEATGWHYWWLITGNNNSNEGLCDVNWVPAKRMYTLGNFSRFVRPGYDRIVAVNNTAGTLVSAYKDSASPGFAIVAMNTNATAVNQTFNLTNFPAVNSVTPWVTSATLSLANQAAVAVTNSSFTYTLPGMSVVTFAGLVVTSAPNTVPTLTPVPDQTVNAGVTLSVTNAATDTDAPPQTLTFSLLTGPTNATLHASTGIFTWRPWVSQSDTTNLIKVQVADNGTPGLSTSNSFTITVNPLDETLVNSIDRSGGPTTLLVNGPAGPDYTLLTSTNLIDWQSLFTTNSPGSPVTLVDTNLGVAPARFYRIQVGP